MTLGWTAACGGVAVCVAVKGASKVNIMGGATAITADSAVITVEPPITGRVRSAGGTSEHWLNLSRSRETDRRNGYENWLPVFSYE